MHRDEKRHQTNSLRVKLSCDFVVYAKVLRSCPGGWSRTCVSAGLAEGTDLELVKRDVGRKPLTRISSATQARDMMMYYLWCLGFIGSELAETSNTPSSTNYNFGASLASRGLFHSSFCRFEMHTKLCVNPSLPNLSTHSRAVSLTPLFPQSSPLVPFHQTKWLSVPHSLECLFSKETVVYWSVVFITTSCIMQTPFLERGSIMYQVNSVSGSTWHSLRSRSRWMRFGKRNSWVL